ncbi:MAG: patatin-like phospholipase family protein [Gemmatimonadetes bacterium]|nr:patatin-like phospholipase family protein [Gemmatimonadota bacterium]
MTERDLAITFAGGGNRAFYQLGLLEQWGEWLLPRTAGVATCSAGAFVLLLYLSRRRRENWEFWLTAREGTTRNIRPSNALRGEPMAPHGRVYRATTMHMLDAGGLERIQAAPFPIWVLTAAFPRFLPSPVATAVGLLGYAAEKRLFPTRIHPRLGRALGFTPVAIDARTCRTREELTDLVLASSATPPFTPVVSIDGRPLLDGGLVDNAPAFLGDTVAGATRNLVLLTRAYPGARLREGRRLYLAPTHPVATHRWDYTCPDLLADTIEQGVREAAVHRPAVEEFLAAPHIGG